MGTTKKLVENINHYISTEHFQTILLLVASEVPSFILLQKSSKSGSLEKHINDDLYVPVFDKLWTSVSHYPDMGGHWACEIVN